MLNLFDDLMKAARRVSPFPVPQGMTHGDVLRHQAIHVHRAGGLPSSREHRLALQAKPSPLTSEHVAETVSKNKLLHPKHVTALIDHAHDHFSRLLRTPGRMNEESYHKVMETLGDAVNVAHETKHPKRNSLRNLQAKAIRNHVGSYSYPVVNTRFKNMEGVVSHVTPNGWAEARENTPAHKSTLGHYTLHNVFKDKVNDADHYLHDSFKMDHPDYTSKVNDSALEFESDISSKEHQRRSIQSTHSWPHRVTVSGDIVHHSGGLIGQFSRTFGRDVNGDLRVNHDGLSLDKEHQGYGISKALMKSSLEHYRQMGVKTVHVGPADVGRYTWAKMGFHWGEDGTRHVKRTLPKFLVEHGEDPKSAQEITDRHADKPWEIASLHIGGRHVGKKYLLRGDVSGQSGPWGYTGGSLELHPDNPGYQHISKYVGLNR